MVPNPADQIETATDLGTLKRRSVHGAAWSFGAQALRFIVQFGSQVVLARLLTPGDFGLVAMVSPVLYFVQIFNELGLSQAAIQRVRITQQELSGLFWINLAVSCVLAILLACASPLVAGFYGEPRLAPVCVCLASLLILSGLSAQQIALMNRTMRFGSLAIIDFLCIAVAVVAGIWCALSGLGYWSLVVMQAVNSLTITVLAWSLSRWRPSGPGRTPGVLSMLRFGGHLTAYNLVTFAGTNLDSVLIGRLKGTFELGLYDRAFRLVAAPIAQIGLPVARIADSLLARLQGNDEQYCFAYLQILEALLLVTVPAVLFVALSAQSLVPLLFGAHWSDAAPIVAWLAVATLFAPLSISSYWLFVSQGRAAQQLRYVGVKSIFQLIALLIGLPQGAYGVARSYALFGILVHGSLLWGATSTGPVTLRRVAAVCLPFAVAAIATAAMVTASEALPIPGLEPGAGQICRLTLNALLCLGGFGLAMVCQPQGRRILVGLWAMRSNFRSMPASE